MFSSDKPSLPASTIITASAVPAMMRLRVLVSSVAMSGLITKVSLIRPTRIPAIGPSQGMSETATAADAAVIARISAEPVSSAESTVTTICVSQVNDFGKRGRSGRSINRLVRVAFSEGLPSRLKNPPGNFPAAYDFSWYSTVRGKKSSPVFEVFVAVATASTTVSPYLAQTDPCACFAIQPDSSTSGRPATSSSTFCFMFMSSYPFPPSVTCYFRMPSFRIRSR